MNKKLAFVVMAILTLSGVIAAPNGNPSNEVYTINKGMNLGTTLYVGGSGPGNYTHIQDGIDNATDGDTVFVYDDSSPYYENVEVDKSINLIGENRDTTVIDGGRIENVISITVNKVTVSNFIIMNSSNNTNNAGINNVNTFNTSIKNCYVVGNEWCGINFWSSSYNTLSNCKISNNSVDGIFLWHSNFNTIINCNVSTNYDDGISLLLSSNNKFLDCKISFNNKHGIWIQASSENEILNCWINSNGGKGVFIPDSHDNIVKNNNISQNGCGVYLFLNSDGNNIFHNNFINNTDQAYDECNNNWDNGYPSGGNYWSDYNGTDNNGDGIGDTPYDISGDSNQDRYPLMYERTFPPVFVWVDDDFNSSIPGWDYDHFDNVQDGIDAVASNGTIYVFNGTYYENVVVDRSINLMGENRDTTVIDGSGNNSVVSITADWVNISGFTMQNGKVGIDIWSNSSIVSGNNISNNGYGIRLYYSSNNNNILGNNISNILFGIWLDYSSSNTISDNNISSNNLFGICLYSSSNNYISGNSFFNNGLFVWNSYQNTVSSNTVNGNPLVYLEEESDTIIDDAGQVILIGCNNITVQNQDLSNTTGGIELWDTDNCLILGNNIISNNVVGIWLDYSSNNTILGNNISNNGNGIYLGYSSDNSISGNNISSNTNNGIILGCSNNSSIFGNTISNNDDGIFLDFSYFNVIKHNNFIKNSRHAGFYYESLLDSFSNCWNRNYWDRPRILPKPIFGRVVAEKFPLFPWLNFDWHPLTEPYGE